MTGKVEGVVPVGDDRDGHIRPVAGNLALEQLGRFALGVGLLERPGDDHGLIGLGLERVDRPGAAARVLGESAFRRARRRRRTA